jgi:hypothetical protein
MVDQAAAGTAAVRWTVVTESDTASGGGIGTCASGRPRAAWPEGGRDRDRGPVTVTVPVCPSPSRTQLASDLDS